MIISHGDLDGLSSALMAIELSGQEPEDVHFFSYAPDRDEKWMELLLPIIENSIFNRDVWFVDISLRPGELEWARCEKGQQRWYWVDHHKSSLDFNPDGIFDEVHLKTGGDYCAADIVWQEWIDADKMLQNSERTQRLREWADVARDRDLWINEHRERNMKLDMILKAHLQRGRERELLMYCQSAFPNNIIQQFQPYWEAGMKSYNNSCQTARNTLVWMSLDDDANAIGICWITGHGSDVADTLYETGNEIIAMLRLFPENVGISFRTRRNDIDLSLVAKTFDGGGHPQAAGGRLRTAHIVGGYEAIRQDISLRV